ncbi:MAG: hypothetical protein L0338_01425, partial [Acidobacteria bacterium]|nr:hypothetical protein [Acidobacteriota bacterium]
LVLLTCISFLLPASGEANVHPVRVGVFKLFRPERIDIETRQSAIFTLRSGAAQSSQVLVGGQKLRVERFGERLKLSLFERDGHLLYESTAEGVFSEETACTLSIPGQIQRDFLGRVEVLLQQGRLQPRIAVAEEIAVRQILRSEMAECRQPEALKAQAILIRSYLRTSSGRHRKEGYDYCDTTHCQFFSDFKERGDRFEEAARATRGLLLTFLGKPFQPLYTAACGGRTLATHSRDARLPQGSRYAYRPVVCGYCVAHPLFAWETTVERKQFVRALKGEVPEDPTETLASLAQPREEDELRELKEKIRIRVGRLLGWNIIRSDRYSIDASVDPVRIRGHGSGHNLGLCQAGAIEMGRRGRSATEILSFYFPGCRIEGVKK